MGWDQFDAQGVRLRDVGGSSGGGTILPETCEGRLTTESGVPVSTTDRTGQGTIYFTPCTSSGAATTNGNITLYSGSALVNVAFTELSLALTVTANKLYDVFVDYNSGTPQLVLSAAWTTFNSRADALGTQNGIIVKSGTSAYRWVGTILADGTNTTADSKGTGATGGTRYMWNAFNQVTRSLYICPGYSDGNNFTTYTTTSATWALPLGGGGGPVTYAVQYVLGASGTVVVSCGAVMDGGGTTQPLIGIGDDSTTQTVVKVYGTLVSVDSTHSSAFVAIPKGIGYHYEALLIASSTGGNTSTFYADVTRATGDAADPPTTFLSAWITN